MEEATTVDEEAVDALAMTLDDLWNQHLTLDDDHVNDHVIDASAGDDDTDAAKTIDRNHWSVEFKRKWDLFFGGTLYGPTERLRLSGLDTWRNARDTVEKLRDLEKQMIEVSGSGSDASTDLLPQLALQHLRTIAEEMIPIELDDEQVEAGVADLMAMLQVTDRDALVGASPWFAERASGKPDTAMTQLRTANTRQAAEGRSGLAISFQLAQKWYLQATTNLAKAVIYWDGLESYWRRNGYHVKPFGEIMEEAFTQRSDVLAVLQHNVHGNIAWPKTYNFNPLHSKGLANTRRARKRNADSGALQIAVRHWINAGPSRRILKGDRLELALAELGVPAPELLEIYELGIPLEAFGIASSDNTAAEGLAKTLQTALRDPKNPHKAREIAKKLEAPEDMLERVEVTVDRSRGSRATLKPEL